MEYGDVIWNNCYYCNSALLSDSVHYDAARLVTAEQSCTKNLLGSLLVADGNHNLKSILQIKSLAPYYLSELLPKLFSERTHYRLRSRENFTQLSCRTSRFQKSFFPSAITGWNSLDLDVRNSVSLTN